eukprot:2939620-Prymnesium_polylepis.1
MAATTAVAVPLYRSLRRLRGALRTRPLLWTAIYNGVVRRTKASQRAATKQVEARAFDDAALRRRFDEGSSDVDADVDAAFAALRSLGQ